MINYIFVVAFALRREFLAESAEQAAQFFSSCRDIGLKVRRSGLLEAVEQRLGLIVFEQMLLQLLHATKYHYMESLQLL